MLPHIGPRSTTMKTATGMSEVCLWIPCAPDWGCSRRRTVFVFLVVMAALAIFAPRVQAQTSDFTIVVLPDTDEEVFGYPQTFQAQTQWIVNNASALNIQMVLGEGDNVDSTTTAQYQTADAAIRLLDSAQVPYLLAIGNRDYDNNQPAARTAGTGNFNLFFGPSRYSSYSWYGGQYPTGSNENFYGTLTIGGKEFLFLMLEFYPRDSALSWARSVMQAHSNDEVIIVTHAYEYFDNTRVGGCASAGPLDYSLTNVHDGEKLWDNFVKQYKNVTLVLSGHFVNGDNSGEAVGRRVDPGINGNLVNQVLANYERLGSGGNGYLRIMKFRPSLNVIEVTTYSPTLNSYLTDTKNQFTLTWHGTATSSSGSTTISGSLHDAACNIVTNTTVSAGGRSTVTDSTGHYSLTVPVPGTVTVSAVNSNGGASRSDTVALSYPPHTKLQLTNGSATISGTVTLDSGGPAAGAIVSYIGASTVTDANGDYQLQNVVAGTYDVTATVAGLPSSTQSETALQGATTIANFSLSSQSTTGSISGRVTDSIGNAISGATVSYSGGSASTDAGGNYTLPNVAPGTYLVTASATGFQNASQNVTVTAGNVSTGTFHLAPAVAGIAFIAGSTGSNASVSTSAIRLVVTLASAIPAGSTIVVALTMGTTSTLITSVTDDGGSIYSPRTRTNNTADLEIWSTEASKSAGSVTAVTINFTAGSKTAAAIAAYSGVRSIGKYIWGTGSTSPATKSLTTQDSNNFSVIAFAGAGNSTFSAATGNLRVTTNSDVTGTSNAGVSLGDNTSAGAGSVAYTNTLSANESYAAGGIELRTVDPQSPVITRTLLTAGGFNSSNGNADYKTTSFTPASNALILATVRFQLTAGTPATPILTGNGLTWVEVAGVNFSTIATPLKRISVFRALGASPTTGPLTINIGRASQGNAGWVVEQFTGVDTSGTNGSGAIVQSGTNASDTSASSITLSAFGSTSNLGFGGFGAGTTGLSPSTGFSAGGGWTRNSCLTEYEVNTAVITDTQQGNDGNGVVGIEIRYAP